MHDALQDGDQTVLSLPLEVKADGETGSFEGYGAVFGNTDRDGDVVAKGAFAESLKSRLPALLWQHNAKEPIGRFDVVREDAKGLYVKGRLSGSGRGAEAYELLKMGALNGLSIGFVTKEALRNRATGTRTIKRAELMEVSLVTFPANELARVNTVKASRQIPPAREVETPRDFERMLRDAGFSRTRAKVITAKGFKGGSIDHSEMREIADLLRQKRQLLEMKRGIPGVDAILSMFETARTPINTVSVHPGDTKKLRVVPVKTGRVTFSIQAPDWAHFKCTIHYIDFTRGTPLRDKVVLYSDGTSRLLRETVDRGKPPAFNPLSLEDWHRQFPRQLVLDSTRATLEHFEHPEEAIRNLPQRPGRFVLKAS